MNSNPKAFKLSLTSLKLSMIDKGALHMSLNKASLIEFLKLRTETYVGFGRHYYDSDK